MTITELVQLAYEGSKAKGWHDEPRSFGDRCALIHSEVSEALEAYRETGEPTATWRREDGKPEGVPSEFADVIIRIADACGKDGIDLERAIKEKLAFNRTRPHRHGGKVL